jgi:MYXO-CTERM domain-containing protein
VLLASTLSSLLAFAPSGHLTPPPQIAEIWGGEPVSDPEHIETVYLRIGTYVCSGTLISERVILTAAHCLDQNPAPEDICIMLGQSAHASSCWGAQGDTTAIDYGLHPDYCEDCDEDAMDIGYILTSGPIVGIDYPKIITDQDEYDALMGEDEAITLVGYGEDESGEADGKKRWVETKIRSFIDSAKEFLAGGSGKDTCLGDSGGPAFARAADGSLRLVGVTSRGFPECGEGGIYTAPLPAMCWVEEQTNQSLLPEDCKSCDCVDLTTVNGCGCQVEGDGPDGLAVALLMLVGWRRRRVAV